MNHDPIVEEVFHHAYVETLFDKAHEVLCPACSKILENEALERYRRKMAKRREEIAAMQVKVESEKAADARRRELEKQNKRNRPKGNNDE